MPSSLASLRRYEEDLILKALILDALAKIAAVLNLEFP